MKITKKNLQILIEKFLKESPPGGGISPIGYMGAKKLSIYKKAILEDLRPYDLAKREAELRDGDKYFHFLAFMNAVSNLNIPDEKARKEFDTIGNAKEFLDAVNPFGATPVVKVGFKSSFDEWKKDMQSNQEGIEAGLAIRKGGSPGEFLNRAYDKLVHTPNDIASKSSTLTPEESLAKLKESYQWAWDLYPELYGDDKVFVQPRYNVKLSPNERRDAWNRWQKRTKQKIPGWVKDLTGPLSI